MIYNTADHCKATSRFSLCFVSMSDIDECTTEASVCPAHSNCNNTVGSYNCSCEEGYTGNETFCKGTCLYIIQAVPLSLALYYYTLFVFT